MVGTMTEQPKEVVTTQFQSIATMWEYQLTLPKYLLIFKKMRQISGSSTETVLNIESVFQTNKTCLQTEFGEPTVSLRTLAFFQHSMK